MTSLSACGLPRSGPYKSELLSGASSTENGSFIVPIDDQVNEITAFKEVLAFPPSFINAGLIGSDTIAPGDTLSLTIWENVDDGLLSGAGGSATSLSNVQVDGTGFIFVPYAGRIKAAGNSPEAIRRIITEKLATQTPDPQVMLTRSAGDGATVTIAGNGVVQIERPTRRLTAMLASAGGVAVDPGVAQVKVTRGGLTGRVWFEDLYEKPEFDIALRDGDRIIIEADPRSYIAMGATGGQSVISFETRDLSALEAIAQVGGLRTGTADPKGVFVLRKEPETIARQVTNRTDLVGDQRVVYVLDLTEPNGLFLAQDFLIRDGDTVYVTEAPFVQWQKTISAITGAATSADSLAQIGQ
ncbi:polysaccharide biosynthesis/export family protein [Celeribacter sp. ASW11-22]|nr:polysaccharide biosynthesis/export family protein [Celeribacter litoreus]MCA0043022.1 polysaccharide biosynthesis/export family protein [Celeribacter litoreus]